MEPILDTTMFRIGKHSPEPSDSILPSSSLQRIYLRRHEYPSIFRQTPTRFVYDVTPPESTTEDELGLPSLHDTHPSTQNAIRNARISVSGTSGVVAQPEEPQSDPEFLPFMGQDYDSANLLREKFDEGRSLDFRFDEERELLDSSRERGVRASAIKRVEEVDDAISGDEVASLASPSSGRTGTTFSLRPPKSLTLRMAMADRPINSTISRDNTAGENARQADLLAHFGTRLRNRTTESSSGPSSLPDETSSSSQDAVNPFSPVGHLGMGENDDNNHFATQPSTLDRYFYETRTNGRHQFKVENDDNNPFATQPGLLDRYYYDEIDEWERIRTRAPRHREADFKRMAARQALREQLTWNHFALDDSRRRLEPEPEARRIVSNDDGYYNFA